MSETKTTIFDPSEDANKIPEANIRAAEQITNHNFPMDERTKTLVSEVVLRVLDYVHRPVADTPDPPLPTIADMSGLCEEGQLPTMAEIRGDTPDPVREPPRSFSTAIGDALGLDRRMEMDSPRGTNVIFDGKGGYDGEISDAKKVFRVGEIYTVRRTEVFESRSIVEIDGVVGRFNTCMFAPAPTVKESLSVQVDPVRANPDDEPDLTPEQEAELQAEFDHWKKSRAVRADPVREELLAALTKIANHRDPLGDAASNLITVRLMALSAIARAESPAPAQEKTK